MRKRVFTFGKWQVSEESSSIACQDVRRQLEPKAMAVLAALCSRAGSVLSAEELLAECWGTTLYGDNPIHKTITRLRKLLDDSAAAPEYIETIRLRGYRAIAPVSFDEPTPAWLEESPFRGLEAFEPRHARVFFGREDASAGLAQAVLAQARRGRALVIVLGPSGSGKTSLVQAGLMPRLEQGMDGLRCASATTLDLGSPRPGCLFTELGSALLDWQTGAGPVFEGESAQSLGLKLAGNPESLLAALAAAANGPQASLLLFLDRFEALFALSFISAEQRTAIIHALDVLVASPNIVLVAACRNDFYPHIAQYPALMSGKTCGAHFDVAPPNASELARIIRLPAQAARLSFGADPQSRARLDDVLCQSVTASPDALPLLQYALQELYRQRTADGELTFEALDRLGGVDGAIGRRAEDVIAALAPGPRLALGRVLALLVSVSSSSDAVTSSRARWSDLQGEDEQTLVTALVDARLLVSELVGDEAGFRVAHEALLRCWPRASEWIADHRNSLLVRARISALSQRWVVGGKPADLLLPPGQQLDEARDMLAAGALTLSADEVALVRVSAGKARLRERLRMAAMTMIVSLAVLATVLGVTALGAQRAAEQRRADAESLVQFMLGELAEKLRPLAKLDLLDSVSAKALSYLARDDQRQPGAIEVLQRAQALHVIGEVRIARGDPDGAANAFSAARAQLLAQLAIDTRDTKVLTALGANAFWLGQIQLDKNKLAPARVHFLEYRDYSDQLFKIDPGNVDNWIEQSYAHNNLGTLALRTGDTRTAASEFVLSIDLKTRALARKPGDRNLAAELADSLSWVAETRIGEGKLADALGLYERELALVEALHAGAPADAVWADRRARALQHRAGVLIALGRDAAALQDYLLAERLIAKNLELEPANRVWQRTRAFVQMEQLRIRSHQALSQPDLAALDDIVGRLAELVRLDPANDEWAKLAAIARQRYAAARMGMRQYAEAGRLLDQSRATLGAQLAHNQDAIRSIVALANNHLLEARLMKGLRNRDGAARACSAARELLRTRAEASSDYKVLDPWIRANLCLARPEMVSSAMRRLSDLGYRDAAYLQYLSHQE